MSGVWTAPVEADRPVDLARPTAAVFRSRVGCLDARWRGLALACGVGGSVGVVVCLAGGALAGVAGFANLAVLAMHWFRVPGAVARRMLAAGAATAPRVADDAVHAGPYRIPLAWLEDGPETPEVRTFTNGHNALLVPRDQRALCDAIVDGRPGAREPEPPEGPRFHFAAPDGWDELETVLPLLLRGLARRTSTWFVIALLGAFTYKACMEGGLELLPALVGIGFAVVGSPIAVVVLSAATMRPWTRDLLAVVGTEDLWCAGPGTLVEIPWPEVSRVERTRRELRVAWSGGTARFRRRHLRDADPDALYDALCAHLPESP